MSKFPSKVKVNLNHLFQNQEITSLRQYRGQSYHAGIKTLGRIGVDWLPPFNAILKMTQKPITSSQDVQKVTSALPPNDTFRWDIQDDVKTRFQCDNLPLDSYVRDVGNQGKGGTCYAWGGAGVLGDRWRIQSQKDVPNLSPSVIVSCGVSPYAHGINGGTATADYLVCSTIGLPSETCKSYDWCGDMSCTDDDVPKCECPIEKKDNPTGKKIDVLQPCDAYKEKCGEVYMAKKSSTNDADAVVGIYGNDDYTAIMEEIWQNGTVMTGFFVMQDFYGPPRTGKGGETPKNWEETDGIYMNGQGIYPYSSSSNQGGHMVNVVGWEKTQIDGITGPTFGLPSGSKSDPQDIYYWVIRNSWATTWNANNDQTENATRPQKPGYFFSAWAGKYTINGKDVDVNKDIALDHTAKTSTGPFGGCWFYAPDTDFVTPEGCEDVHDLQCDTDADCEQDGYVCDNGQCTKDGDPPNECQGDEDCEDGYVCNDGQCEKKSSPKPKPKPQPQKQNMWQQIWTSISEYFGGCKGACTWDKGQCIAATTEFCDFISEGSGRFEASKTCPQVRNISYSSNDRKMKTAPCTFQDGMCMITTKDVCRDNLKGAHWWGNNAKDCFEARKKQQKISKFKKKHPNCPTPRDDDEDIEGMNSAENIHIDRSSSWIMPTIFAFVGFFLLLLVIGLGIFIFSSARQQKSLPAPPYGSKTFTYTESPRILNPTPEVRYSPPPPAWQQYTPPVYFPKIE